MTRGFQPLQHILRGVFLCCVALTAPVSADPVRVRAGEHPDFSRLVLDLDGAVGWALGRTDDGYALRLDEAAGGFDLSDVFRKIPRRRIADISVLSNPSGLSIRLGCDCHANAFTTSSGSLVIDVAEGRPSPESPFETALPSTDARTNDTNTPPKSERSEPLAGTTRYQPEHDRVSQAGSAVDRSTFRPGPEPDPRLAFFWRGTSTADHPSGRPQHAATDPASGEADLEPDSALAGPQLPDPRVLQAEKELLHQFSRATVQGLITLDPSYEISGEKRVQEPPPESGGDSTTDPAQTSIEATSPAQPIHAETSIDRDMLPSEPRHPVTADGAACLPDASFDVSSWGDGRPASIQIAERRGPLVGEFDRASEAAVNDLVRLYLFLGFGAEARAVLSGFAVDQADQAVLLDLADILDDRPGPRASELPRMTDCDTAAALWALLAWPEVPGDLPIDTAAVAKSFSGLPVHLRRQLGPDVVERLLAHGQNDAARAVRDAIARAPGDVGAGLRLVDMRLGLAAGNAEAGEAALAGLETANDPLTPEALVLTIGSKLDRGLPVEPALVESAGALAYELKDASLGPELARAHILGLASTGDFAAAFEARKRELQDAPESLANETLLRLFRTLGETADEATFLSHYFALKRDLANAEPDLMLRLALAGRLVDAGFSTSTREVLKGEAALTESGRRLLARAALTDFDPLTALEQLEGLQGAEAESVRAEALSMAGDHGAAADAQGSAGNHEAAAREAWRAGDWAQAEQGRIPLISDALTELGRAGNGPEATEEETGNVSLGQARTLVEQSRTARSAIETLLSSTPAGNGG